MTREVAEEGKNQSERNRIFLKVKEKIDAERQEKVNHQKLIQEEIEKLAKEKEIAAAVAKANADRDEILKKQNFLRDQEAEKRA